MMGECRSGQEALFYEFSLERHVPAEHLLRSIDRFVELDGIRCELAPFYSEVGRPSIDPELLIRMLIVGYCFGIRSERRLCEEVHLNAGIAGNNASAHLILDRMVLLPRDSPAGAIVRGKRHAIQGLSEIA